MSHEPLVELLYQTWADLDHAIAGLTASDADASHQGLSRVAWTVGHLGQQIDSWFNVRFAGGESHPLLSQAAFRTGASGEAPPWPVVVEAVDEVRRSARRSLDGVEAVDMDRVVPYSGGIEYLRPRGLRLSYALLRTAMHHSQHTGEILTIRSLLGHDVEGRLVWGEALI